MDLYIVMDDTPHVADWDIVEANSVDAAIKQSYIRKPNVTVVAKVEWIRPDADVR